MASRRSPSRRARQSPLGRARAKAPPLSESSVIDRAEAGLSRFPLYRENPEQLRQQLHSLNERSRRAGIPLDERDKLLRSYAFNRSKKLVGGTSRASTITHRIGDLLERLDVVPKSADYIPLNYSLTGK